MTTKQIYDLAVKMGIKSDLRGEQAVKKYLARTKKKYKKLDKEEKKEFDMEKLTNPYSDTRILVDNNKPVIKKVLAGIDIEGAEILLADKFGDIDLLFSHHPAGKALNDIHSTLDMQAEMMTRYGVPINIGEAMVKKRVGQVNRRFMPMNTNRSVDMARILSLDFICSHTACDNLAASFIEKEVKSRKPEFIGDLMDLIKKIPEYQEAIKINDGPEIFVGDMDNSCGKIVASEFTGGTNLSEDIYEKMAQAGVGTILSMHMKEEHRKEAKNYHINVIATGHIASDSLGMNLFLDELELKGIKVIPCSGLMRIKRKKN